MDLAHQWMDHDERTEILNSLSGHLSGHITGEKATKAMKLIRDLLQHKAAKLPSSRDNDEIKQKINRAKTVQDLQMAYHALE
jgi:hypothetical protein